MNAITLQTGLGAVRGIAYDNYNEFRGIRYATAERWRYAVSAEPWDGVLDATSFGPACPQKRAWTPHLENPERLFYYKEFRDGVHFDYGEDCLRLNIFAPKDGEKHPVIVFFHGGGFDSGATNEKPFDGAAYAARGVILVTAAYRVGILGYMTHETLLRENGHEGNFGLYDQYTAVRWVREHIADYGGDGENITLMGQSAGAISIQYLCLSPMCKGLFRRAIMLSGAGLFPKFSLPRPAADTRAYWEEFMRSAGAASVEELRGMTPEALLRAVDSYRTGRKGNIYNTMPVLDGTLLPAPVDELIKHPLPVSTMIGCTNNDMYAPLMYHIGKKYAKQVGGYLYYFNLDAPGGKDNGAFHSADLYFAFGTLARSWRPYTDRDREVSDTLVRYITAFAATGDPNAPGLPQWVPGGRPLVFGRKIRMGYASRLKQVRNMLLKGDPT